VTVRPAPDLPQHFEARLHLLLETAHFAAPHRVGGGTSVAHSFEKEFESNKNIMPQGAKQRGKRRGEGERREGGLGEVRCGR
jgi:hypothetical protein